MPHRDAGAVPAAAPAPPKTSTVDPPPARTRKRFEVEVRIASDPLRADELRRREQELERLIIKAACRRAARLAELLGHRPTAADHRAAIAS